MNTTLKYTGKQFSFLEKRRCFHETDPFKESVIPQESASEVMSKSNTARKKAAQKNENQATAATIHASNEVKTLTAQSNSLQAQLNATQKKLAAAQQKNPQQFVKANKKAVQAVIAEWSVYKADITYNPAKQKFEAVFMFEEEGENLADEANAALRLARIQARNNIQSTQNQTTSPKKSTKPSSKKAPPAPNKQPTAYTAPTNKVTKPTSATTQNASGGNREKILKEWKQTLARYEKEYAAATTPEAKKQLQQQLKKAEQARNSKLNASAPAQSQTVSTPPPAPVQTSRPSTVSKPFASSPSQPAPQNNQTDVKAGSVNASPEVKQSSVEMMKKCETLLVQYQKLPASDKNTQADIQTLENIIAALKKNPEKGLQKAQQEYADLKANLSSLQ